MKFSRKIRKLLRKTSQALLRNLRNPKHRLPDNAYFIVMGTVIVSLTPYYGWRTAYRAAKRYNSKAFIMKGSTANRYLQGAQWDSHFRAWGRFNAVPGQ